MGGTKEGGKQTAITAKKLYGDDFHKRIGKLGGSKLGVKKGFALWDPIRLREHGRVNGKKSKRT